MEQQREFVNHILPLMRLDQLILRHGKLYPEMEKLRKQLNDSLNKFDKYEGNNKFWYFIRKMNLYDELRYNVIYLYGAQKVSKGWLKCYEILQEYHNYFFCGKMIKIFCNAELPGGFLLAINHFLCSYFPDIKKHFYLSSWLDPKGLPDQYGIAEHNPDIFLPNLIKMKDAGDTTNIAWIRAVRKLIAPIHLYTSDAGIDVSENYNSQEELTQHLNYGQILCGLATLTPGGCMVTKQYTVFTPFSVSLLALLASIFERVILCKPRDNMCVNCEIYVISLNYLGISDELLEQLYDVKPEPTLELVTVPPLFYTSILQFETQYVKNQTDCIEELIATWKKQEHNLEEFYLSIKPSADAAMAEWLEYNPVEKIPDACKLATN